MRSSKGLMGRGLNTAQNLVTQIGKTFPFVLQSARDAVIALRRQKYERLAASMAVEPRTVVFQSFGAREYSCSPRALYERMLAEDRFGSYELIWALRPEIVLALQGLGGYEVRGAEEIASDVTPLRDLATTFGPEALAQLKRAVIVPYCSAEYYRSLARAGYWIANCILPDHVVPRSGQTFVQTWHGTPLKIIGCDITTDVHATYSVKALHDRYRREGARATYFVAPSRFAAEKFRSAFDLERSGSGGKVLETGYPRNDVLSRARPGHADNVKRRLGVPGDKTVVLYAPTWRDDLHETSSGGFVHEMTADLDRLRAELGDDHVILFRSHYLVAQGIDFGRQQGFVIDVSDVNDINDLYVISDVLVTDYSSVFFDFANLRRPIIFYMYDLERFSQVVRGLYLGVEELPGPVVRTDTELVEAIRASREPDDEVRFRYERFVERFNYLDDGDASERVLERIMPRTSNGAVSRDGRPDTGSSANEDPR